jgi:hypothetical protein
MFAGQDFCQAPNAWNAGYGYAAPPSPNGNQYTNGDLGRDPAGQVALPLPSVDGPGSMLRSRDPPDSSTHPPPARSTRSRRGFLSWGTGFRNAFGPECTRNPLQGPCLLSPSALTSRVAESRRHRRSYQGSPIGQGERVDANCRVLFSARLTLSPDGGRTSRDIGPTSPVDGQDVPHPGRLRPVAFRPAHKSLDSIPCCLPEEVTCFGPF